LLSQGVNFEIPTAIRQQDWKYACNENTGRSLAADEAGHVARLVRLKSRGLAEVTETSVEMPVYITSSFVLYLSLLGDFIGPSSSLQGRSRKEFIEE
jgi:hypothetical protein